MEQYLAHSAQNGHPAQSYKEHIENTKNLALIFAEKMKQYCRKDAEEMENILGIAAESHDLGKLYYLRIGPVRCAVCMNCRGVLSSWMRRMHRCR